jgi:hypothetical protein
MPLCKGFYILYILKFRPSLDINTGFNTSVLNISTIIIAKAKARILDNVIIIVNVLVLINRQIGDIIYFFS